jgi:hypothetical protein
MLLVLLPLQQLLDLASFIAQWQEHYQPSRARMHR